MSHPYQAEFEKNYYSKKAIDWMLERVFKPDKYPEFHDYLNHVHEEWIASQIARNRKLDK
jgi:hypothetical protein